MSVAVSGTSITFPDASSQTTAANPTEYGFKNRIINGAMQLAQRATSATVTAGTTVPTSSTGYPCVDRFFVYSTGANVTAAQVAGSGSDQYRLQITGAASVTAVGVGQRIEQKNSYDMAGSTATLSVDLANSVLTTVTWTASYANTADTFGTIGTPTKTQIATGTFTVTSTVTNYSTQISIPSAATTGIEILFTVGAQTSGTWTIGKVQLEKNSANSGFDRRSIGTELALCQRYYQLFGPRIGAGSADGYLVLHSLDGSPSRFALPVIQIPMRAVPSVTAYSRTEVAGTLTEFSSYTSFTVSSINNVSPDIGGGWLQTATSPSYGLMYRATYSAEVA